MDFELSTPTADDCGRMAEIHVRAMDSNPLLHAQFPTGESIRRLEGFLTEHYASMVTPRRHKRSRALIARHLPSRQIASFAAWDLPVEGGEEAADGAGTEKLENGAINSLKGCQREYLDRYAALSTAAEAEAMKSEKSYHLTFVCTDPQFQRMGAGEALTRAVMDQARASETPVYLESTVLAAALYLRLGFVSVGGFELKIPQRGSAEATEDYREICMVWRPSTTS